MGQKISVAGGDSVYYHYKYDDMDRLIRVDTIGSQNRDTFAEKFFYDSNGNRTYYYNSDTSNTLPFTYHTDSTDNQLDSILYNNILKRSYLYDDAGNVSYDSYKNMTFNYDVYGQLSLVTKPQTVGTDSLMFGYSPEGQRVWKKYIYHYKDSCGGVGQESIIFGTEGLGGPEDPPEDTLCTYRDSTITIYIRSKLNNQVLAEYDGYVGGPERKYIYAGNNRIAMIDENGDIYYYLNDHLGTTRVIVKEDGTVTNKYERYLAFGADNNSTISKNQAYRYTGKPFDADMNIDIYYYGARYYDDFTGRFMAVDPLKSKYYDLSPYSYCNSNPVIFYDVDGMAYMVSHLRNAEIQGPLRPVEYVKKGFGTQIIRHPRRYLTITTYSIGWDTRGHAFAKAMPLTSIVAYGNEQDNLGTTNALIGTGVFIGSFFFPVLAYIDVYYACTSILTLIIDLSMLDDPRVIKKFEERYGKNAEFMSPQALANALNGIIKEVKAEDDSQSNSPDDPDNPDNPDNQDNQDDPSTKNKNNNRYESVYDPSIG